MAIEAGHEETYASGTTPLTTDRKRKILVKILTAVNGGGGGGGGTGQQTGTGTPVGVKTPTYVGQLYTNQTAPYGIWIATGLTNADWQQLLGEP